MSIENTELGGEEVIQSDVSVDDTDLDAFEKTLFGEDSTEPAETDEDNKDSVENNENEAPDEDPEADSGDDVESDEDADDEEEPKGGKKKNRFQDRIDELTGSRREAERRAEAAEQKLNEVLDRLNKLEKGPEKPTQSDVKTSVDGAPDPDALNEDGTPKYELGQFDPEYLKDMVQHAVDAEREAYKQKQEQEQQQKAFDEQRAELTASWNEKLAPAQERYPDFQEKGQNLVSTFESIDAGYGEYLTSTLMSMEYGPDVLYYLANNVDEATKIVNSGPARATVALGRLEAKFAEAQDEKTKARPKVSKAPTPPPTNKGSSTVKGPVAPDTDDLDSFERMFFKKG